jgi:hypothetical protein
MIDYFADPQNEQLISGLNNIFMINLWTWTTKYDTTRFYNLYMTWTIWTGEVYVESLDRIEDDINYVLYTWFNLYNILYGSWSQLSGYDQFVDGLETINNLLWEYEYGDIENHDFKQSYFWSSITSLLTISILSCYLKDYDRCYNYRSQAYYISRNVLYAKWWFIQFHYATINYGLTLKVIDFLIKNNMIDDVIYKKILTDLDSWNIYTRDQLLHNMKVSEYNFFKYMIYNTEEGKRRLW